MLCGGHAAGFEWGAKFAQEVEGIRISGRHLRNLTVRIGGELQTERDRKTESYASAPLPRVPRRVAPSPQLAGVEVDGGRMQTRAAEQGPGVHQPHWRETKTAGFFRMKTTSHAADPHPSLPRCFADRQQMRGPLAGVGDEPPTVRRAALRQGNAGPLERSQRRRAGECGWLAFFSTLRPRRNTRRP